MGRFLAELRAAQTLGQHLYEEIKQLWQHNQVYYDEAVIMCCTKQIARQLSMNRLKNLEGPKMVYFVADWHGKDDQHVYHKSLAEEDSSTMQGVAK